MRIASWNINSVRARVDRLTAWLQSAQPDVLCLQEIKCQDHEFPHADVQAAGYHAVTHGQKTYNGVAILARADDPIEDVRLGMQDDAEDPQSRVIAATVRGVRVVGVYVPNGQSVGAPAYQYKLDWFGRLRRYLDVHHAAAEPLIVCGDYNVAPDDRDVHDPAAWAGHVLCSAPERQALQDLCAFGLQDTLRLRTDKAGIFSWWDYRSLSFAKNAGLRIDLLLATAPLARRCTDAGVDREARKGKQPSDHAPVWATFSD